MVIINGTVLLLKAEKSDDSGARDKYKVMLSENGFTVKQIKTLEFEFKALTKLREKLDNPDRYSGIIFTTPRSVRAVKETLIDADIHSKWKELCNYVVGETTAGIALNELGLNCKGQHSGNAKNLSDVIAQDKDVISKPLLFPCGNLKGDILIYQLNKLNIEVETITVYDTVASTELDQDFIKLTTNYTEIPEYFVYFSPSGVRYTIHLLKKIDCLNSIKFIAIGPTTESALKDNNLPVAAVAIKPTPSDLLSAILSK